MLDKVMKFGFGRKVYKIFGLDRRTFDRRRVFLIIIVIIISLNRRMKTQFLFKISNELFCFSNKLLEITASIIKLHLHL